MENMCVAWHKVKAATCCCPWVMHLTRVTSNNPKMCKGLIHMVVLTKDPLGVYTSIKERNLKLGNKNERRLTLKDLRNMLQVRKLTMKQISTEPLLPLVPPGQLLVVAAQ